MKGDNKQQQPNFTQPQSAQLESRAGYGLRSRALSLQHATVDTLRASFLVGRTEKVFDLFPPIALG